MQYFFFHLMPWPYLPADFDATYDSAWVWLPNSLYDPVKGHELYREYINTLAYADELGFDSIWLGESWGYELFTSMSDLVRATSVYRPHPSTLRPK